MSIRLRDYAKTDEGVSCQIPKRMETKAIANTDYTVDPETDYNLIVAATTANVDISLPLKSSLVGKPYQVLVITPIVTDGYRVRIKTQGTDDFPFGNTYFDLPASQKSFSIGLHSHDFNLLRNFTVSGRWYNNGEAASVFSSPVALGWDEEDKNTQPQLLEQIGSRIYCRTAGTWIFTGGCSLDSTGGSTWNASAELHKNGVAVPHTTVRTGNYGSEDQSMVGLPTEVDMAADDYIEVFLDQNNLTGSLIGFTFTASIRL